MKLCSKCNQKKDEQFFYLDKSRKDGLSYLCKECKHKDATKSYNVHREKRLIQMQLWHIRNRDKHLAHNKQWRSEHPEWQKEWQIKNPELWKILYTKHHRIYRILHPEKIKELNTKRKRELGWNIFYPNIIEEDVAWHHINDDDVVALPEDLHLLYGGRDKEVHRINLSYIVQQLYGGV